MHVSVQVRELPSNTFIRNFSRAGFGNDSRVVSLRAKRTNGHGLLPESYAAGGQRCA
jgi:hypothetical protein